MKKQQSTTVNQDKNKKGNEGNLAYPEYSDREKDISRDKQ